MTKHTLTFAKATRQGGLSGEQPRRIYLCRAYDLKRDCISASRIVEPFHYACMPRPYDDIHHFLSQRSFLSMDSIHLRPSRRQRNGSCIGNFSTLRNEWDEKEEPADLHVGSEVLPPGGHGRSRRR
jgi:hypothetical protein